MDYEMPLAFLLLLGAACSVCIGFLPFVVIDRWVRKDKEFAGNLFFVVILMFLVDFILGATYYDKNALMFFFIIGFVFGVYDFFLRKYMPGFFP